MRAVQVGNTILDNMAYQAVFDESLVDALAYAKANGFAGVQLAVEPPHLSFETLDESQCQQIAAYCKQHHLRISLHAHDSLSLFEPSFHLCAGMFDYLEALFLFAERVAAPLVTLHIGAAPRFRTDTDPPRDLVDADADLYAHVLGRNLARLAQLVQGRPLLVCFENCTFDLLAREALQSYLDSGRFHLCWDIAKTFDSRGERDAAVEAFFWRNLSAVRQVHLHDLGDGRSHRVIGTGQIDFLPFLSRLSEAPVAQYCIEVRPREKALESLRNLRRILEAA